MAFPQHPECFQQQLNQCLEGLKGVYKIADDLLIIGQGDTDEKAALDYDLNLRNPLDSCRARNTKLNKEKFQFKCSEVSFIGHAMSRNGLKTDRKKVEAIIKMERPADFPAVQRFLGLVKVLSKFLQDLSELYEPLRRLTHKNAECNWTHEQENAFEKIKDAVSKAPIVGSANPTHSGVVAVDGYSFFVRHQRDT